MILIHSMKKFTVAHNLFPYNLKNALNNLYQVLTLMAQTYTESLLNDGSALDGHYLYRVTLE